MSPRLNRYYPKNQTWRSDARASIHPMMVVAFGLGVAVVLGLLFLSWNSLETSTGQNDPPKSAVKECDITDPSTKGAVSPAPVIPSLDSMESSKPSSPVVREEPKSAEEVFMVVEPAPTPEPVYVPVIYGRHSSRAALSEDQRRLLDQLADDFNKRLQSSGMGPYAPGYAELWKESAQQADDVYRQHFGEDALQALKGGPPPPVPEPTPLSPEDETYRMLHGEEALELRVLEREGRLIRVPR